MSSSSSVIVARLRAAGCVFAEDEERLLRSAARTPEELTRMVEQRAAGAPIEHVLGWAQFCGLRIGLEPGVFVPRHRTEHLVRQAVALAPGGPFVAVDMCCGSGALGAALAAALDGVELHAVDIDPVAVRCARRNLASAGAKVYQGDLFEPLPVTLHGRVRLLIANVPYVPTAEIGLLPSEARVHEPSVALDGGADGLDVLRRVASAAPRWLSTGGYLLIETSSRQAPLAADAMAASGLVPRVAHCAELDSTVVIGNRTLG